MYLDSKLLACMWGACDTHAFSIFPETPTHRVRALRHTPYRWIQRSSEKRLRRLFHLPCDRCRKSSRCLHRLPEKFLLLIFQEFFFRQPFKRSIQAACTLIIFKNPIKISRYRHAGCFSFLPPHSTIIRPTPPVPAV